MAVIKIIRTAAAMETDSEKERQTFNLMQR